VKDKEVVILGAGICGLSCANELSSAGYSVIVIEKENFLGGMATTINHKGLRFDLGPHKIYTTNLKIKKRIKKLIDKDLLSHPKRSSIKLFDKFFEYPINFKKFLLKMPKITLFKFMLDFVVAQIKKIIFRKEIKNSQDYFLSNFGNTAYQTIFKPLFHKVYGHPQDLHPSLAKTRLSFPSLSTVITQALFKNNPDSNLSAKRFYYPRKGIIQLSLKLAKNIEKNNGKIYLSSIPEAILLENNLVKSLTVSLQDKKLTVNNPYAIISTIPLSDLIKTISPPPNRKVMRAIANLKYKPLTIIYLLLKKQRLFKEAFIFYPENKYIFQRLSEQKAFSKEMVPVKKTLLMAEVTHEPEIKPSSSQTERIIKKVIKELKKDGLINDSDIQESFTKYIKNAYPLYSIDFPKNLKAIQNFIKQIKNLYSIGRQGKFLYVNMDHSFDMGIKMAKHIINHRNKKQWQEVSKSFSQYKIID